ncbi:hypothetical protein [Abyssisolibacter fermentans]|uniref:hypothetical protein n=1 Tax=Abyssisolibacter fermentans TaxID=1766203 RepID=UPI0008354AAA|nr:hypothetical protein [Abyssisolibacter fermentans]
MRIKFIVLVLAISLLTGCTLSTMKTYNNDDIDTEIKTSAQKTIDKFFKGIINQDINMIKDICLITDNQQFDKSSLDYIMQTKDLFKKNNPILLQQLYTVSNNDNITVFLPDFDGYACTLPTNKMDAFTSFYTIENGANNILIMVNLLKDSNKEWKMSKVYFGEYEIMGKGIEDWIYEAKKFKDKGYLLSACSCQYLALRLSRPSKYMNYLKEDTIKSKYEEFQKEVIDNYSFPMKIQLSNYEIEIYNIDLIPVKEGYVYQVKYVTKQDIINPNENQMEKEADFIHKQMEQIIPGFGKGISNCILYSAFSEPPIDPNKQYKAFSTIVEE